MSSISHESGRLGPRLAVGRVDPVLLCRLAVLAILLLAWQGLSGRVLDPFWFSSPTAIAATLWKWAVSGLLWRHLLVTFKETLVGFAIGSVSGVLLAFAIGSSELARKTCEPFLTAIYGVPKVALAPLFIMWFGIGLTPKIVLAAVSVFFLVFFSTVSGIGEVDRKLGDAMRVMGASPMFVHRRVTFPAALPWVFSGLKLGLPYGFVGAVAAEMMAANAGIGFLTQNSAGQLDTAGVFAALFALMAVTTLLNTGLARLERWCFRWR